MRSRSRDWHSGRDHYLNDGGYVTALIYRDARTKPQKYRDRPPATGNRRLAEQTRKILGKHYANKYRVR